MFTSITIAAKDTRMKRNVTRNKKVMIMLALHGFELPKIRRALLMLNGHSGSTIAKELGLSRQSVQQAVTGHRGHPKVQAKIAEILEVPQGELFVDAA